MRSRLQAVPGARLDRLLPRSVRNVRDNVPYLPLRPVRVRVLDRGELSTLVRNVLAVARERQLTLIAAGVAFYAFLSLVPIALLVIGVATSLGGDELVR